MTDLDTATTSFRGLHELILSGRKLYRSDRAHSSDEFPVPEDQWTFHKVKDLDEFAVGVDLAYVYIHIGGGSFRCLAKVLGLDCVVEIETLCLPHHVMEGIAASSETKRGAAPWPLGEASERCLFRSR